jgi:hypothetical protein
VWRYWLALWDLDTGQVSSTVPLVGMHYARPVGVNDNGQIVALVDIDDQQINRPYLYDPASDTWTAIEL